MIITNQHNLPEQMVQMAQQEWRVPENTWRVTSLLKGLKEAMLERRHHDEITVDVADMVWLLFGTAVHHILERQETPDELKEERLRVQFGKYFLTGQFDLYNDKTKTITDYKTASVWKVIYKDYEDWKRQLLIYAYMLRQLGFNVKKAQVVAFLKDHSKTKAMRDSSYPQLPVETITFTFTEKDFADIEPWLNLRFDGIAIAENEPDDEIPHCTEKERWNDGGKWAVMKKGRKSALRLLFTEVEARAWMEAEGKGEYIEHRPGEDTKCLHYCRVKDFCSYWREASKLQIEEIPF